jgi:sugar lactone lactonase YvrE
MRYIHTGTNILKTAYLAVAAAFIVVSNATAMAAPAVVTIPGDHAFPESITSTSDGTLYVGSLARGGIMRVKPGASQAELWIKPGAYGSRSTFGVLADERSNTLWVCSNDASAAGVPGPGSAKGSALKGFDLTTGKGKVSASLPGTKTLCNDIAIGPDRSVYVTNTFAPQILRLKPGAKQFEVWATDPNFEPPQKGGGLDGIAFGSDGNLYVDTFTKAELFRVEVQNGVAGKVTKLQPSQALVLTDGLRPLKGNVFLMIEGQGKLDRVTVDGDKASIETIKDGFSGPTGVTLMGDAVWVSEGQLAYLFDPAKKELSPRLPFSIYRVPLSEN